MNALLEDSRVVALFDKWAAQTGLGPAAAAVAQAARRLEEAANIAHWTIIRDSTGPFTAIVDAACVTHGGPFCEAWAALLEMQARPQGRVPGSAAFVRDTLGLRWAWLPLQLFDAFLWKINGRATGVLQSRTFSIASPRAPKMSVIFETAENESLKDAQARFARVFGDAWRKFDVGERGQPPKRNTEYLGNYARWFYRKRVKDPPDSIGVLAREYHARRTADGAGGATNDRKMIQHGIRQAERLLGLGKYELIDPREE